MVTYRYNSNKIVFYILIILIYIYILISLRMGFKKKLFFYWIYYIVYTKKVIWMNVKYIYL